VAFSWADGSLRQRVDGENSLLGLDRSLAFVRRAI